MKIGKFAEILRKTFSSPFLPEGFVHVAGKDRRIKIIIGDRDVEFDGEGHILGSGFNVGEGVQWRIERIERKEEENGR